MEFIEAKTILQRAPKGSSEWFGMDYNMNLYKGCCHGCIYCDSRSSCYQIENFDTVRIKKDCIAILEAELQRKRKKGVVSIGAMSDTYNPFEKKHEITRRALALLNQYGFGASIDTKSDLICRDIDILTSIAQKQPLIAKLSITCAKDELSRQVEQNVCPSSARFKALEKLSSQHIFTGVLLTPILPFISDSQDNIKQIIQKTHEHGGKFVFSMGGVTLRENQRDYFYQKLDEFFPGLKQKYQRAFAWQYYCKPDKRKHIRDTIVNECERLGLLYKMPDIIAAYKKPDVPIDQLSFFDLPQ